MLFYINTYEKYMQNVFMWFHINFFNSFLSSGRVSESSLWGVIKLNLPFCWIGHGFKGSCYLGMGQHVLGPSIDAGFVVYITRPVTCLYMCLC